MKDYKKNYRTKLIISNCINNCQQKPVAEAKSKLTGKNICMSNFGEAVATLEKFLFFKKLPDMSPSKGKKKTFQIFYF